MGLLSETEAEPYVAATRTWLERVVIGLNLCPFARAVHVRGLIRWTVSDAVDEAGLLADLTGEMERLAATDPAQIDTTMLIHPFVLHDFDEYNSFLDPAEERLVELGLEGVIQLAGFHPDYLFAGEEPNDMSHHTNRSPYPTLHLLREESVGRALEGYAEPERIYRENIETLRKLGKDGWKRLGMGGGKD